MPDIENAEQLATAITYDARAVPITPTIVVPEVTETGHRRDGIEFLRIARETILLRRDRDYQPTDRFRPQYDFELTQQRDKFNTLKNAVNRAAERARFR